MQDKRVASITSTMCAATLRSSVAGSGPGSACAERFTPCATVCRDPSPGERAGRHDARDSSHDTTLPPHQSATVSPCPFPIHLCLTVNLLDATLKTIIDRCFRGLRPQSIRSLRRPMFSLLSELLLAGWKFEPTHVGCYLTRSLHTFAPAPSLPRRGR